MTLEQLVPTLEVCQQLKTAGFPQDTALVWIAVHELDDDNDEPTLFPRVDALDDEGVPMWNFVAAPTAGELEEWLFVKGYDVDSTKKHYGDYAVGASKVDERVFSGYKKSHVAAPAALVLEVAG